MSSSKFLFGGPHPWSAHDWTVSDDRVRGGASQSYLTPTPTSTAARFHGLLDINSLGAAGFASQRSTNSSPFDLSAHDGLLLTFAAADSKSYTLTLKDEAAANTPYGTHRSSLSWEFAFVARTRHVYVPWALLKPTFRGRELKDARALRLANVCTLALMMRSFFGDQQGAFDLTITSIAAVRRHGRSDFPHELLSGGGEQAA